MISAIELGDGVLAEAERQIVGLQIVGEADPHQCVAFGRAPAASAPPSVPSGIRVAASLALEVAEHQVVAVAAEHRIGQQRDLAAAARRVDDVVRHRVAGGMAAQLRDDLEALLDRRAEVRRAADRVALVEVVRPDADHQQLVHQLLHRLDVVVDALEQHGLAAERNAGVGEPAAGLGDLGRELVAGG